MLQYLRRSTDKMHIGYQSPLPLLQPVYISGKARQSHVYIAGITGKGKSKLLEYMLFQDVAAGRGCILIDPHSDLITDLLRLCLGKGVLSSCDTSQVVYFDPAHSEYLIPFNVLRSSTKDSYTIAQSVVEALRRAWPESLKEAPHFSNVAIAAFVVLIENKLTLVETPRLLIDKVWREQLLGQVQNEEVVRFFRDRYDKWGREAPMLIESTLNKVAAFSFNPQLRRVLGAKENHLDLRAIMDAGQVLLVDLGRCDGETRRLLGSLLVTSLEQAATSRNTLPASERRPCYAYIDEFQDFAANIGSVKSLSQILSECRKVGLHLTLAHQTISQLDPRMIGALGNIQTKVIFGVSRQDAEWFAKDIGHVDTEAIKHEPQTETQYPLFSPLVEQWEGWVGRLRGQQERQAFLASQDGRVTQFWTTRIPRYKVGLVEVQAFCRASMQYHGKPVFVPPTHSCTVPPHFQSPAAIVSLQP